MNRIDWLVLILILSGIIAYGLYKSRTEKNLDGYFLSNRSMPWYLILLSVMGTQASAITFLSAPGQAFTDGMRFVQYYFGLPLAMIVICISFVPLFSKLKVYTAYEFLEQRFNLHTRVFTSFLFLLSRGLSTGISIYAPAIILSSLFGWNIYLTNILMGGLLIIYTVSGGAKAVAYTQQLQLAIIFIGMIVAAYMIVHLLPNGVGFTDALKISGSSGKLNVITTGISSKGFNWNDKYNLFSGIIGGFFLALSYFGTDQSQVGRYLTAKNDKESKVGLLMNGLVKVPMQFGILLIGALLFTFYQFTRQPIFFNQVVHEQLLQSSEKNNALQLEAAYNQINQQKQQVLAHWNDNTLLAKQQLQQLNNQAADVKNNYQQLLQKAGITGDTNDTNYIFLRFVIDYLPHGLVGLLIAIIFLASWGSIAAALNSLAATSVIDFHLRFKKSATDMPANFDDALSKYHISKYYTLAWGIFCIVIAEFVIGMGSLIEAVNVLGSLFYGVILGIFLVAFYMKQIKGNAVFWAAIFSELVVILIFVLNKYNIIGISFLWLNVIGALLVMLLGLLFQYVFSIRQPV
ncbi:sodium:solute symporter [Hydrotalea sandarakina]|jgi:SSS family solute:Na+ symporter|uniref:SSS family transporter n=1 Tax=Hydrotalea sandarakina TaxID=1004304 RepID=A0A2W7RHW9_9BACT|nr:sodium:solute symporter [Hydrotalea sandarakina]PZX59994.1 SSS family transporter [Hydrotalea sandarakina]